MNRSSSTWLVGILAGIASALLSLGAGQTTGASLLLFFASPLPVLIASLGWGTTTGLIAALVASSGVAVVLTPVSGFVAAVTSLLPAAWIGHLSNLARPASEVGGPQDALAWYPLAGILQAICGSLALGLAISGAIAGYGPEVVGMVVDEFLAALSEQGSEIVASEAERAELVAFFTKMLPAAHGGLWVLLFFGGYYLALAITRRSGRVQRPKDDLPATLRMPRASLLPFGIGLILTFFDGPLGLVGSLLSGTFGAGFMLAGFALMHHVTRAYSWRPLALWFAYVSIFLFALPAIMFVVAGVFDTSRTMPLTRGGPPTPR